MLRVLLVDDHAVLREGLRALLSSERDLRVVGEAPDGRTAVRLVRELQPDVVVIGVMMPELNGIDATRKITAEVPGVRVMALSGVSDRRFVAEMLRAGATSYISKECGYAEVVNAIRATGASRTVLSDGVASQVVSDYVSRLNSTTVEGAAEAGQAGGLTTRQREVLQLMAEGRSTKEIAASLHLSVKTIESHRRQLMTKLDIHTTAGLIKYAVREGLASLT